MQTEVKRTVHFEHDRVPITWSRFEEWKALRDEWRGKFGESGFPLILGTPSGYFLDVPELSAKASALADKVRARETKKQKRDVSVGYQIHLCGDQLIADISWSRFS